MRGSPLSQNGNWNGHGRVESSGHGRVESAVYLSAQAQAQANCVKKRGVGVIKWGVGFIKRGVGFIKRGGGFIKRALGFIKLVSFIHFVKNERKKPGRSMSCFGPCDQPGTKGNTIGGIVEHIKIYYV